MKTLLDGARYVYSRGQKYGFDNVFIKPGGYDQALDDFARLYAKNVVKKSVENGKIVSIQWFKCSKETVFGYVFQSTQPLKRQTKIAADDILIFYFYLSKKIRLDFS